MKIIQRPISRYFLGSMFISLILVIVLGFLVITKFQTYDSAAMKLLNTTERRNKISQLQIEILSLMNLVQENEGNSQPELKNKNQGIINESLLRITGLMKELDSNTNPEDTGLFDYIPSKITTFTIEIEALMKKPASDQNTDPAQQDLHKVIELKTDLLNSIQNIEEIENNRVNQYKVISGDIKLSLNLLILGGGGVFLLYLIIIAFINIRLVLFPLKDIQKGVESILDGQIGELIVIRRRDEFGILATSFNKMTTHIQGILNNVEFQLKETRRVEKELRESEQKLFNIIQGSPIPTFVINDHHQVTQWNKALEELSGIKAEDIIKTGQHWKAFYNEERPCLADLLVDEAFELIPTWYEDKCWESRLIPEAYHGLDFFPDVGKKGRWLRFTAAAIRDTSQVLIGVVETLENISIEKRAELALRESEERYRLLVETMNEGLIAFDEKLIVRYVNPKICEMLGLTSSELLNQEFFNLFDQVNQNLIKKQWEKRKMGSRDIYSVEWRRKDGSAVPSIISPNPIFDSENNFKGSISLVTDISERKIAEENTFKLNLELEKRVAERTAELEAAVSELDSFSQSISHDLRAPLRIMDGFSQLLLEEYSSDLSLEAKKYIHIVINNFRKMDQLINDLLSFSRMNRTPLQKKNINLGNLIKEVLEDLKSLQTGRDIEMKISDLPPCLAEPNLLKQVFVNLLSNSFKFTRTRDKAVIEIGFRNDNSQITYFIKDNGVGFNMQYANKLFGVFQRLHPDSEYEGTGVGLSIVQRIIQRHGGKIWAESEEDQGATFFFTLS